MKNIRLIAIDLDGTLLDDEKRVPPENIRALAAASERGVHVAIASGRMIPRIEPIVDAIGIDCALIAYNGAKVVSERAGGRRTLSHRPIPAAIAERLLAASRDGGYLLNFYLDDVLYAESGDARRRFMEIYSSRTGAIYTITELDRFRGRQPTKLILLADPAECDRLHGRFASELGATASISKSDPEYLEIMAPGVTKGAALPELAAHFGVSTQEVLVIGDADNDKEMLAAAGIGVAVANAGASARAAADFVTERDNNSGAVAEAVERFVL